MFLHMTTVKIIPDAPTNAPDTISALLDSMNPAILVDSPERAFRNDIDTGISPPPIAMTAMTPYILARAATIIIKERPKPRSFQSWPPVNANTPKTVMADRRTRVTAKRYGITLGLDDMVP